MERDLIGAYAEKLLLALRPKLVEVMGENPVPLEMDKEALAQTVLIFFVKTALDFSLQQNLSALEFSMLLRGTADAIEREVLAEFQHLAVSMEPAALEELMQEGVEAEEKLDRELRDCQSPAPDPK